MESIVRPLPQDIEEFSKWGWERIEPYYARLQKLKLTARNVHAWLADWSQLASLIDERFQRLTLANTQNTADKELEETFNHFVEEIYPKYEAAEQVLKEN